MIYDVILFFLISMLFFLIISPISLIMKILNIDLLNLKKNTHKTYWKKKKKLTVCKNNIKVIVSE